MQLTDAEIREILIREKKRKRARKKKFKRMMLLLLAILLLVLAIGIFINRDANVGSRGRIFIDAGHGGVDGGSKVGKRLEKNDTLTLALVVKEDLEKLGFKVYMSREDDKDVDRAKRGKLANQNKAQLFVSIHRNQADKGNGVEVFIPSSNDSDSRALGKNILVALVEQGFAERSVRAGTLVSEKEDYLENSVPNMPSCLVEVGFLQSKKDNALFDDNLENNAMAIAEAIENTFIKLYEDDQGYDEV